jgi:hypothetical protein
MPSDQIGLKGAFPSTDSATRYYFAPTIHSDFPDPSAGYAYWGN